jgi:hypothetical protein
MYNSGSPNYTNSCFVRLAANDGDSFNLSKYYGILKVAVGAEWLGASTQLIEYLPIGARISSNVKEYFGADRLIYDSQGRLSVDESYYNIHKLDVVEGTLNANYWQLRIIGEEDLNAPNYFYAPTFDYDIEYEQSEGGVDDDGNPIIITTKISSESNNVLKPQDLYFSDFENLQMTIVAYNRPYPGSDSVSYLFA